MMRCRSQPIPVRPFPQGAMAVHSVRVGADPSKYASDPTRGEIRCGAIRNQEVLMTKIGLN